MTIELSHRAHRVLEYAYNLAVAENNKYLTPEHVLYAILSEKSLLNLDNKCSTNIEELRQSLKAFISFITKSSQSGAKPQASKLLVKALENAKDITNNDGAKELCLRHIIYGMIGINKSFASYLLQTHFHCSLAEYLIQSDRKSDSIS